jgi:nucleotide-binding universal stress UspA family protein
MFEEIVIADDGHEGGLDAIALGELLATPVARMVIAHAVVVRAAAATGTDTTPPDGRTPPGAARLVVRCRSVDAGLHELVAGRGSDVLVVGSHHRGLAWFGDHTRRALHDATCPVAVAPRGYARRPERIVRTIGIGHLDTAEGRAVLDLARDLAWQLDAKVHATRVAPPSRWDSLESGAGWRAVAAARRMAEIPGVQGSAVEGDVGRQLAALARTVDLLIVGSHHHRALRRFALGEVATSLARHVPCPLLVVPTAGPPRR